MRLKTRIERLEMARSERPKVKILIDLFNGNYLYNGMEVSGAALEGDSVVIIDDVERRRGEIIEH